MTALDQRTNTEGHRPMINGLRARADELGSTRAAGRFCAKTTLANDAVPDSVVARAVARAKEGDREAVRFLYLRYADNVYGYVRSIVRDDYEAEDVTQHVFAKLITVVGKYEARAVPFSAWILRLAHTRRSTTCARGARSRRPRSSAPTSTRTRPTATARASCAPRSRRCPTSSATSSCYGTWSASRRPRSRTASGAPSPEAEREHRAQHPASDDGDPRRAHAALALASRRASSRPAAGALPSGEIGGGWMRPTRWAAIRRP